MLQTRIISILISVFIAFSASGRANLFGIKLSIIMGVIIFLNLLFLNQKEFGKIFKMDLFTILILVFSVSYAFLIDAINNRDSTYILITKTFIILFSFLLMRFFINKPTSYISPILIKSNSIILIINIIVFYFSINPSYSYLVNEYSGFGYRLKGFDEQTNGYALMLIFNVSISFYSFIKRKSLINIIALALSLILSIMTQSRSLLVAIFMSIFITYLLQIFINNKLKDYGKFFMILISSVLIISSIMTLLPKYLYNNYGIQLSRFNEENDTSINDINSSNLSSERFDLYKSGIETLVKYPLGIGYADNNITIYRTTGVNFVPHNLYIQILLNYGFIFGLFWILLLLYPIIKLFKNIRNVNNEDDRKLLVFFIMMNIQLLFFFLAHSSETIYMWFFIGLSISFARNFNNHTYLKNLISH
jgi:O-antigen ligase